MKGGEWPPLFIFQKAQNGCGEHISSITFRCFKMNPSHPLSQEPPQLYIDVGIAVPISIGAPKRGHWYTCKCCNIQFLQLKQGSIFFPYVAWCPQLFSGPTLLRSENCINWGRKAARDFVHVCAIFSLQMIVASPTSETNVGWLAEAARRCSVVRRQLANAPSSFWTTRRRTHAVRMALQSQLTRTRTTA